MKQYFAIILSIAAVTFAFADDKKAAASAAGACCAENCCELLTVYEKVSTALAADDLKAAKEASSELDCWATCSKNTSLSAEVGKIAKAATIKDARASFKAVSALVIPLAQTAGAHYVMTCPMAKADWIQTKAEVANPYYGASMLRCGAIKQTVAASKPQS